ncbi:MAG: TolC family protein, partial [Calditrichaeota bacterium]
MVKGIGMLMLLLGWMAVLAQENVLEAYVQEGLQNNLALQQQEFSLQQAVRGLHKARGMFFPSVTIEARYSRAGGGRTIDFPAGDLLNPIYATLNELLAGQGIPPRFPTDVENVTIPFLREKEHDTKVRVIQPLVQPALWHNYSLQKHLLEVQRAQKQAFARQLVAEIKTAYFTYLKAVKVVDLFRETETLLQENLRVSESLFRHQKATQEVVFRARAELSELQQHLSEAEKNRILAASYFNFLLNRPLNAPIVEIPDSALAVTGEVDSAAAQISALRHREEFRQLSEALKAAGSQVGLARAAFLPGISLVYDYGFQGEKYRFGKQDDYWMASVVLRWNLFHGFQDKAAMQQAQIQRKKLRVQQQELEQQIALQVQEAYENVVVARQTLLAAQERVISARKSFEIVRKKYREGMAPQIEFLDARTTLTRAEINHILARYDYHIRLAELERVAALRSLEQ